MSKKVKNCPACEKEVAKSAKVCPHCGKKLKMGLFLKGIIGIVGLIILGVVLSPSSEEKAKERASILSNIANAQPSNISPTGKLATTFKLDSKSTDIQRDNLEKEITGKIVQWTLPVYEVSKSGNGYRIQTSGNQAIMGGAPMVGSFITISPKNETEKTYIENLKTGDQITFKGKITGTSMRNIDIKPAILIL